MNIGGYRWYGLVLIDIDEMLEYFGFGRGIGAHHFWSYF